MFMAKFDRKNIIKNIIPTIYVCDHEPSLLALATMGDGVWTRIDI